MNRTLVIHIFDQKAGEGTVYSFGGSAPGVNPLARYLSRYNPERDPSVRYNLQLSEEEVMNLQQALDRDIAGPELPQYDGFFNNCAQYSKAKILDAASISILQEIGGRLAENFGGPDVQTNAVLTTLSGYGLLGGSCE